MPDLPTGLDLTERISSEYYSLTSTEKKVADYIVGHRGEAQHMSISELAQISGAAEATLSRFARRLGYKGYNDFRTAVAISAETAGNKLNPLSGAITENDSFDEVLRKLYTADMDAVRQTSELLTEESVNAAVNCLAEADKVFCMGQGGSSIIAEEAAHLFTTIGCKYFCVVDSHTQMITAATLTERDTLLYFSYSGATKDMIDTLSLARKRKARIILITHFLHSPGAALADVVLLCGANESPLQLGSVPAKMAQIYIIDVLFSGLCLRDLDGCTETRHRIADALAEKHL